jgi:hypothetical protein
MAEEIQGDISVAYIYQKPTTTNTAINFLSNHPMEHKIAAYRHHITRMHSLPLTPK